MQTHRSSQGLRDRYPADIAGVVALRMVGCHVAGRNVAYTPRVVVAWTVGGLILLAWHASYGVGVTEWSKFATQSLAFSIWYALAGFAVLNMAHRMTQNFLGISVPLWEALTSRGRRAYSVWYATWSPPWKQISVAVAGVVATTLALRAVEDANVEGDGFLTVYPASYAVVQVVAFIVGATAYWGAGGIKLCAVLTRPGNLRLYPLGPAYTPGVEELSRLLLNTSSAAILLIVILLSPVIISTANLPLTPGLSSARLGLIGVCAAMLTAVGIVPQLVLSRAIKETRRSSMRRLMRQHAAARRSAGVSGLHGAAKLTELVGGARRRAAAEEVQLAEKITWLASSPTSTIGSGNTVQILASSAGILAPILFTIFTQTPE